MNHENVVPEIDKDWHPQLDAPAGVIVPHQPAPGEQALSDVLDRQIAKYALELGIDPQLSTKE